MNSESLSPGRRLLKLFAFSLRVKKMIVGIVILFIGLLSCWGLILLIASSRGGDGAATTDVSDWGLTLSLLGLILLPLVTILLSLAALFEKRYPPRSILWFGVVLLILADGGLLSVLMAFDLELDVVFGFTLMIVLPLALLFSMPGLYSFIRTLSEVRAILQASLSERVLGYIKARGAVRFTELSSLMAISLSDVDDLADELLRSGRLIGTMDTANQWIYTAAYLAEQQRLLLEWIQLRGRIHLDELARLLKEPADVVTDWIYQLVQRNQFNAYVNWSHGWIYAATAGKIGLNSQCPQCGGQLSPGPVNTIRCLYCGTEGFGTY